MIPKFCYFMVGYMVGGSIHNNLNIVDYTKKYIDYDKIIKDTNKIIEDLNKLINKPN